MLKFFTRLEKTRNFVLLAFAVIMVASLMLFYAPTRGGVDVNLATSQEVAASVDGEKITVGDLAQQKQRYAQFSQGRPYPASLLLNGLIANRITRIEAAKLGLTASDAEVSTAIREQFKPQDGSAWDQTKYEQMAADQAGSVPNFEKTVRDELSAMKLRAFITSGVTVSDEELLTDFQKKNTKFDVTYVALSPADLAQTITPSDDELRAYLEKNKTAYYIGSPQKKIKYIFLSTEKIGQKLAISDEELRAEFDKVPEDKKNAGVNGQEIVLRVPKPEFESTVSAKAAELVQRLRKDGPTVSEQVFADLAKGQSESPTTASGGGKLKGPVRENLNNPTDPYQRLIKMKPGEVSDPINYQGRYFILRRGETVPKTFEDAKKEIEVSLRNRRAYSVAAELAQKVDDSLKQTKDVQKTAAEFAGQANMSVGEMVRETGYVKPGDTIENIGNAPAFEAGIEPLANPNDVGDKIAVQNGFAIPMLVDRKEPRDADFDEVKSQLVEVVKMDKARQQIEQIANQIAAGATSADGLAAAAQSKNIKAKDQAGYILGSPLGEGPSASSSDELDNAIFAMKQGEAMKTPVKIGENYYVVGVKSREDAKTEDFAKQRTQLMEQMLAKKRGDVFGDYLAAARQRLETAGDIKIYKDAVAKLDAQDAQDAQPGQDQ